jgi:tripartite-type tricarboxylate transporter receptor subunit TctC
MRCREKRTWRRYSALFVMGFLIGITLTASAEDFYKNKTITIVIGADAGGTYDVPSRLLARHLSRHIPGSPRIVVQAMPGGAGSVAVNYVYGAAAQDGTVLLNLHNTFPLARALGMVKTSADITKLRSVGNMSRQSEAVVVWHTADAKAIEDARHKTLIMGATSAGANTAMMPKIINRVLGTKFKVVTGYKFPALQLAMERGEINGQAGTWIPVGTYANFYKEGKLRVLLQGGYRDPSLKGVPLLEDLVERGSIEAELVELFSSPGNLGRPTLTGPGVPNERVELLRRAYENTMADEAFLADADRVGVPIRPMSGADLENLVKRVAQMPASLIDAAKAALHQ